MSKEPDPYGGGYVTDEQNIAVGGLHLIGMRRSPFTHRNIILQVGTDAAGLVTRRDGIMHAAGRFFRSRLPRLRHRQFLAKQTARSPPGAASFPPATEELKP